MTQVTDLGSVTVRDCRLDLVRSPSAVRYGASLAGYAGRCRTELGVWAVAGRCVRAIGCCSAGIVIVVPVLCCSFTAPAEGVTLDR